MDHASEFLQGVEQDAGDGGVSSSSVGSLLLPAVFQKLLKERADDDLAALHQTFPNAFEGSSQFLYS